MQRPKNSHMLAALVAGVLLLAIIMSGCTGQQPVVPPTAGPSAQAHNTTLSPTTGQQNQAHVQKVSVTGSTTVLPIVQKAAEELMKTNNLLDIQVSGGGSGVGIQAAGEGTADIGMSSRDVKADEKTKFPDLQIITIARDGIAVIVNPSNPVSNLSVSDIQNVFSGQITNWKQLGGADLPIVVVGRDSASGTREFFTSAIMKDKKYVATQLEKNSNGAIKQTIAQTPGAIGYVSIGFVDTKVKPVGISENKTVIQPTIENVKAGAYPVSRDLYLLTRGQPTPPEKTFIDYVLSPDGQKLVQVEGYVPVTV